MMSILFKLRFFRVLREISLFFEYRSQIKNEKKSSSLFEKFNLRIDWIGRLYTVINLPPEVTESPDLPKDSRPAFVMEEIKPINDYLKQIKLEELVTVGFEPIKNTNEDSFLVVYYFLFREITWLWILRTIAFWSIAAFAIKYFFFS